MARKVFFSFDYDRDIWRVSQVRNSWVTQGPSNSSAGWFDHAEWESVQRADDATVKTWINRNLEGSSVTIVCIGAKTYLSRWVHYEIEQSHIKGNGLLGIRIHSLQDQHQQVDSSGANPFKLIVPSLRSLLSLSPTTLIHSAPIYDWVTHDGRRNLGHWVEKAARAVGR